MIFISKLSRVLYVHLNTLTVSEIGSLKSSPSTNTVYRPVIEPLLELPARSNNLEAW